MRVAFIGNVNCMPFGIAKAIKNNGGDVVFYVDAKRGDLLHRPEHRFKDISFPYPEWIKEVKRPDNIVKISYPNLFNRKLIKELNQYDAVFTNDYWHCLIPYLKVPAICLFSGSDLDVNARLDLLDARSYVNNKYLRFFSGAIKKYLVSKHLKEYREGIRRCISLNYFPTGIIPFADKLLEEIKGGTDYDRWELRGLTFEDVAYSEPPQSDKLILFNPTRFIWKTPLPRGYAEWENKRNDIMIEGIGLFYARTNAPVEIHLVEKGIHVEETKELAKKYGIDRFITWHKEMSQKDIFEFYRKAHIVFDQLGNQWVGAGGLDAMLTGRPVIANGRPEIFKKIVGEEIPVCQATNAEEVSDWLIKLNNNRELIKTRGKQGREYVLNHYDINKTAHYFLNRIRNYYKGENQECF